MIPVWRNHSYKTNKQTTETKIICFRRSPFLFIVKSELAKGTKVVRMNGVKEHVSDELP